MSQSFDPPPGRGLTIMNNSNDNLGGVQLLDSFSGVPDTTSASVLAHGGRYDLQGAYRYSILDFIGADGNEYDFPVYTSNNTFISITGSAVAGYQIQTTDMGNYEFTYWGGFSITLALFLVLYYVRAIRLATRPIID